MTQDKFDLYYQGSILELLLWEELYLTTNPNPKLNDQFQRLENILG